MNHKAKGRIAPAVSRRNVVASLALLPLVMHTRLPKPPLRALATESG
jgi:hypothetical protein